MKGFIRCSLWHSRTDRRFWLGEESGLWWEYGTPPGREAIRRQCPLSRASLEPNKFKGKLEFYCFWPKNCQTFRAKGKYKTFLWKGYKISDRTEWKWVSEYVQCFGSDFTRIIIRTIHYCVEWIIIWNNFQLLRGVNLEMHVRRPGT